MVFYDPNTQLNLTWIYLGFTLALMLIGMIGIVAFYIYRINRRLGHTLQQSRQAEIDLRKLSIAVEQSPVSVVITDLDTVIQYVNPRFTQVTGYSAAEAIGQKPHILNSGQTAKPSSMKCGAICIKVTPGLANLSTGAKMAMFIMKKPAFHQ